RARRGTWQNDPVPRCARNGRSQRVSRHSSMKTATAILAAIATGLAPATLATDVNVIGLFPGKAVVVIDRGAPRTLSVGQRTAEGVLLVSANSEAAVLEIDGKRQELQMGQHFETAAQTGARNSVTLAANEYGHF